MDMILQIVFFFFTLTEKILMKQSKATNKEWVFRKSLSQQTQAINRSPKKIKSYYNQ